MKKTIYLFGIINLLLFSGIALCATSLDGEIDGAFYRIEVPDNWNGDLVVYNHGMESGEPAALDFSDLGPLAGVQYAQGYALAASSFRMNGWVFFKSVQDNENLIQIFTQQIGPPNNIYMTGGSMGGLVSEQYLEKGHVGHVAAAYSLCGPLAGSKNLDAILDLRLIYDAVCAEVPGAAIPGGADGLPADTALTEAELAAAIHACTGVLYPPEYRSPEQQARLDKITEVARIDETSLMDNMAYALIGVSNLVHSSEKLDGRNGLWNYFVDYGDPEINAAIERTFPDPRGRVKLKKNYTPKGHINGAKLLAMHGDKDDLVFVENLHSIQHLVSHHDLSTAVVVQDTPGHCDFTSAEAIAGWESVRTWVDAGIKPDAQSIQQNCELLQAGGLAAGPCRIDPDYEVDELDNRIRPRIPKRSHH